MKPMDIYSKASAPPAPISSTGSNREYIAGLPVVKAKSIIDEDDVNINLIDQTKSSSSVIINNSADIEIEELKKSQVEGWKINFEEDVNSTLAKYQGKIADNNQIKGLIESSKIVPIGKYESTYEVDIRPQNDMPNIILEDDQSYTKGVSIGLTYENQEYKSIYNNPEYIKSTYNVEDKISNGGEYHIPEYKSIYNNNKQK